MQCAYSRSGTSLQAGLLGPTLDFCVFASAASAQPDAWASLDFLLLAQAKPLFGRQGFAFSDKPVSDS